MYFDDYREHKDAKINPGLLWEYDMSRFDFQAMRNVVVQRVVERGWPEDWWAALNLYGNREWRILSGLYPISTRKMNFVSVFFEIPLSEMKCTQRQSHQSHWNS